MGSLVGMFGGAISGDLGQEATHAQVDANNEISDLNAKTGNSLRQAKNAESAAEGGLARFVQSVNNNRALEAGGNAQEALVVNAVHGDTMRLQRSFSQSIQAAEQAGHAAASQASAGVSGNVVDMVNASTALRDSIVQQSVADDQTAQDYAVSRRAGNIASQMVSGLDSSVIMDTMDYNVDVAQHQAKFGKLSSMLHGAFPNGATEGVSKQTFTNVKQGISSGWANLKQRYNDYGKDPWANNADQGDVGPQNPYAIYEGMSAPVTQDGSDGYGGDSYDYGDF